MIEERYKCKKCNVVKSVYAYHLGMNNKTNRIYRQNTTCKECLGIKSRSPLFRGVKLSNQPYDHSAVASIVNRIDNHKGWAKECDRLPLVDCYTSVYESLPVLISEEDKLSFMYLKLKEFLRNNVN